MCVLLLKMSWEKGLRAILVLKAGLEIALNFKTLKKSWIFFEHEKKALKSLEFS